MYKLTIIHTKLYCILYCKVEQDLYEHLYSNNFIGVLLQNKEENQILVFPNTYKCYDLKAEAQLSGMHKGNG